MPEKTSHISMNEIVAAYDLFHKKGINPEKVAQIVAQMRLNQGNSESDNLSDFNDFLKAIPIEGIKNTIDSTRGEIRFELSGLSRIAGFRPDDLMTLEVWNQYTQECSQGHEFEKTVKAICSNLMCNGYLFLYEDADDFLNQHKFLIERYGLKDCKAAFDHLRKLLIVDNPFADDRGKHLELSENDKIAIADFIVQYIQGIYKKNEQSAGGWHKVNLVDEPQYRDYPNKYFMKQYKLRKCTFFEHLK